ncbi:hypothetical protein DM194_15260 (plasmid) [Azospirillum ramasamyi]|uniref:Uncharacterized protein n=1 Tax=Azospirillum ramasamyi TaxID=682998 RepID=A0A2U9S9W3_9PROT|nr:hypothetical protein DM194_15260 [Azospirillum ramasamyi]
MGIRSVRHHGASYNLGFDRQGGRWHVEFARMEGKTLVIFISRDRSRRAVIRAVHAAIKGDRRKADSRA